MQNVFNARHACETQDNKKKKRFTYSEKSEKKRATFVKELECIPPEKRVYVDEMGIAIFLNRLYGYAPRGVSVHGVVPGRRHDRLNVIGAFCNGRHYGVKSYRHTTNFAFFERWFVCLLAKVPRGCTIISAM